jgi:hypothetical protein
MYAKQTHCVWNINEKLSDISDGKSKYTIAPLIIQCCENGSRRNRINSFSWVDEQH